MSKSFRTIALAALIVGSIGLGSRASATSGELYGVPASCTPTGYFCIYDNVNFVNFLYKAYGTSVWPTNVQLRDSSAFNNGSMSWDVRVDTTNGYYCLSAGRSWHDLTQVGPPSGGNYNNKGFQHTWYQNYC